MTIKRFEKTAQHSGGLYDTLANCHPKIARGQVWCRTCGATVKVDPAECFRMGWPLCCGETMTLDAPTERDATAGKEPS